MCVCACVHACVRARVCVSLCGCLCACVHACVRACIHIAVESLNYGSRVHLYIILYHPVLYSTQLSAYAGLVIARYTHSLHNSSISNLYF